MGNDENLYSLDNLKELMNNDSDALKIILNKFIKITPGLLNEMNIAYKNKDIEKLKKIAHEIKPSIDILDIKNIQQDIRLIEVYDIKNESVELYDLILKVNNSLNKVVESISNSYN